MPVVVRAARPEEFAWALKISRETAWEQIAPEQREGCDRERLVAWTQAQMHAALRAPGSVLLVAEGAGPRPAGYILVAVMPHPLKGVPVGFFLDVWVDPQARRQGIAGALCVAAEAHCRSLGLTEVLRTVAAHNRASLEHALQDGAGLTQHLLSKRL